MNMEASPIECEPLAHAALTVKFMPFKRKIVARFIFTVEFNAWNTEPDPISIVSFFSRMISVASITG
jgi:hypothetical protein